MLILIAAMVLMAGFGVIVRRAQRGGHDLIVVGLVNYLVATAFYAAWCTSSGLWTCDPRAVAMGVVGGVLYGVGFLTLLAPMRWRGVGIVSAILGLSVLVPVSLSLIVWHESLVPLQAAGTLLALAALPLLGLDEGAGHARLTRRMALIMTALFFINGGAMAVYKWFHSTGLAEQRPAFLLYLFMAATAVLLVVWLGRGRRLGTADAGWGALLGVTNMLAGLALLAALDRLPGLVVFPVVQVGIMILATLFAALAWREKPGRLGMAGIAVAAVAVALLNLG